MKVQTTVNLPIETKKQVRIIAAELNISMGNAALELIKIGLAEYKKTADEHACAEQPAGGKPAA